MPAPSNRDPSNRDPSNRDQLDRIWAKLLPLFISKRDALFRAVSSYGITPPHGMTMTKLLDGPLRMRDIADELACDASYVTAIVDRLEELGFATRQPNAVDRRVKDIVLTARGREVADEIQRVMTSPPEPLRQLSRSDLAALAAIIDKVESTPTDTLWPRANPRHHEP